MSEEFKVTKDAANRMLGQRVVPGETKVTVVDTPSKAPRNAKDPIEMTEKQLEPFLRTGQVSSAAREASKKKLAAAKAKAGAATEAVATEAAQTKGAVDGGD
ncbi:hypothetical protein [uncultured Cohaesibacter sp.]|uniref:hypothetical protein n=1 Tax=uncultured Cohaesibacter sp. TaxID=1002546 RepID=UPI0029C7B2BB|nr:hypothetical protein [uncultured Cohaesibacter sp.]